MGCVQRPLGPVQYYRYSPERRVRRCVIYIVYCSLLTSYRIIATGGTDSTINVWNLEEQLVMHACNPAKWVLDSQVTDTNVSGLTAPLYQRNDPMVAILTRRGMDIGKRNWRQ